MPWYFFILIVFCNVAFGPRGKSCVEQRKVQTQKKWVGFFFFLSKVFQKKKASNVQKTLWNPSCQRKIMFWPLTSFLYTKMISTFIRIHWKGFKRTKNTFWKTFVKKKSYQSTKLFFPSFWDKNKRKKFELCLLVFFV